MSLITYVLAKLLTNKLKGRGPGEGPPRDTSARVNIGRSGITGIGGMRDVTQQYAREHGQTLARVEPPKEISQSISRTPKTPTITTSLKARRQI